MGQANEHEEEHEAGRPNLLVEDMFSAEYKLRIAAREFSSVEQGQFSIRRGRSRDLRDAAREFGRIVEAFEAAMAKSSTA